MTMTSFNVPANIEQEAGDNLKLINAVLDRLAAKRVQRVEKVGPLAHSKLAWKVATFKEALLYRMVALGQGCAVAWNRSDALGAALAARAFIETVAIVMDFDRRLRQLLDQENLDEINDLVMNRSFSSRDEEWLKDHSYTRAVSIMTVMKNVDKKHDLEGMLTYYHAALSELCHPNRAGHLGLFGKLDRTTATVTYSDAKLPNYGQVIGSMLLTGFAEPIFERLDQIILRVADLQHRLNPV
jgi:hypothetical protein